MYKDLAQEVTVPKLWVTEELRYLRCGFKSQQDPGTLRPLYLAAVMVKILPNLAKIHEDRTKTASQLINELTSDPWGKALSRYGHEVGL